MLGKGALVSDAVRLEHRACPPNQGYRRMAMLIFIDREAPSWSLTTR
jgi:hypothetical protein